MTKAELIKTLEDFDDDFVIAVSLKCDSHYRKAEHVKAYYGSGVLVFESDEIPHEDEIIDILEICYNERKDKMLDKTRANIEKFLWGTTQEEIHERIFNENKR